MKRSEARKTCLIFILLSAFLIVGCGGGGGGDNTHPSVLTVGPLANAVDVGTDTIIIATFSEAMDPATITSQTFTLAQGETPVAGAVSYSGVTAVFTPSSDLIASTVHTATITSGAMDEAGNPLTAEKIWSFTTGAAADTVAPTVSSTIPADAATNVTLNGNIVANFSEAMNPATITTQTFTLAQGETPVPGVVTYLGTIATLNPTDDLAADTTYDATITVGAEDLAGNPLTAEKIWSFTTGAAADTVTPTVFSTIPADAATNVALNGNIVANFSEAMDPATINETTFSLVSGTTDVPGVVTYLGTMATLHPDSDLAADTTYDATITVGAKDLAGNPLAAEKIWSFTTGADADTVAPTVSSTFPADAATNVAIDGNIAATFSEVMDPETINETTFTLTAGTTDVPGVVVTYSGTGATFNPTDDLAADTLHTATITVGAKDLAGNALTAEKIWSFTTGDTAATVLAPVDLATAGSFVILGKTGISTVPTSDVTGDIGVSPAAATFITGFGLTLDSSTEFSTSSQVTGKVYAADYTPPTPAKMTAAVSDMETAYTDAAGRAPGYTELYAGDISGKTLAPGVYKWGTGLLISNVGVTLSGGPDDVWIFQIGQGLTVANSANVVLAGEARPENIFWQSADTVEIGTYANFEGIVLGQTKITVGTGASVNGRLLAQTAVTLDQNAVTAPVP